MKVEREKIKGDKDADTSASAEHVAHQHQGDCNIREHYTPIMFALHLREELRADKIEIRAGLNRLCHSPACAGFHLESVRPCDVGLSPYKCSGIVHDIARFV